MTSVMHHLIVWSVNRSFNVKSVVTWLLCGRALHLLCHHRVSGAVPGRVARQQRGGGVRSAPLRRLLLQICYEQLLHLHTSCLDTLSLSMSLNLRKEAYCMLLL